MFDDKKAKQKVLIVDDAPENIDILGSVLKRKYDLQVALNGKKALQIALSKQKPDIILLDIQMPVMDGHETCRRLKADARTRDIPVIFVTSLDKSSDEGTGFRLGAVDYITKPVSPPLVMARVNTHLSMRASEKTIQKLLKETLLGSISAMSEVLALANPTAFSKASRLKKIVRIITQQLDRTDNWKFELAAVLSQIGCVTIPNEVLAKHARGEMISVEEEKMLTRHPELGAKLVQKIPQLEDVAEMIAQQNKLSKGPFPDHPNKRDAVTLGTQLLKMADYFERGTTMGSEPEMVFQLMIRSYDPILMEILGKTITNEAKTAKLMITDLTVGMVLGENVHNGANELILEKGTTVTQPILEFLAHINISTGIHQPILVSTQPGRSAFFYSDIFENTAY